MQLSSIKKFHVRLMSIVLDVDVEPSTTPWDPSKAYLFVPVTDNTSAEPIRGINWELVEKITETNVWDNPLQRARPDVYLGTNERTLGGDRREYGFGKLRNNIGFGQQKSHPTYGIRGAVASFDVVRASGLLPVREEEAGSDVSSQGKLMMADGCMVAESLIGKIVTAAHSGKRFYVDTICYDMSAETSFPRKEGYLGPLEYNTYADYYKQKYVFYFLLEIILRFIEKDSTNTFFSVCYHEDLHGLSSTPVLCKTEKKSMSMYILSI